MIYKDFQDLKLAALGMGTMRLPVLDGNNDNIDVETAKEMIDFCMKSGISDSLPTVTSSASPDF